MSRKTLDVQRLGGIGLTWRFVHADLQPPDPGRDCVSAHGLSGNAEDPRARQRVSSRSVELSSGKAITRFTPWNTCWQRSADGHRDITIDMDGPEPPILDGSAAPFLAALSEAGLRRSKGSRIFCISPSRQDHRGHPSTRLSIRRLELDVTIESRSADRKQSRRFTVTRDSFESELSRARTSVSCTRSSPFVPRADQGASLTTQSFSTTATI